DRRSEPTTPLRPEASPRQSAFEARVAETKNCATRLGALLHALGGVESRWRPDRATDLVSDFRSASRPGTVRSWRSLHAGAIERARNLGILHEPCPDPSGPEVLCAQQRDADVDADHVRVHPAVRRMEGVGKAVAPVDSVAVAALHFAERRQRD